MGDISRHKPSLADEHRVGLLDWRILASGVLPKDDALKLKARLAILTSLLFCNDPDQLVCETRPETGARKENLLGATRPL